MCTYYYYVCVFIDATLAVCRSSIERPGVLLQFMLLYNIISVSTCQFELIILATLHLSEQVTRNVVERRSVVATIVGK